MNLLLRRRMLMMVGKPEPPQPIGPISYLRGGADGSYIDTGITPDNNTRVIVWARNWNPYSERLFGSRNTTGTDHFDILTSGTADVDRIRVCFGSDTATYVDNALPSYLGGYHKYELNGNNFYVDDVLKATAPSATFTGSFPIHILGVNNAGTHEPALLPIDICAAKIYQNGVLVRDFTAMNSPSVGLYDAVSDTLFTNAGSGSFTYGAFNPLAYASLSYVECDGSQYFDSGVVGKYSDGIVCKCTPMATNAKLYDILGVVDSSTGSCRFTVGASNSLNNRMYFSLGNTTTTYSMYNSTSPRLTNLDIVLAKSIASNQANMYRNNTKVGSTATASAASSGFVTTGTMYVGGAVGYDLTTRAFIGRFHYIGFGAERSYIPALVNNVAGLYDTYNDVFYPSTSGSDFIAGSTI